MSHTPTPWALVEGPKARGMIKSVCRGLPQQMVAQATGQHTTEEREANAAFIVKACNEHDALRRRVVALETIIREDLHPDDCSDDLNRMLVEQIWAFKKASAVTSNERKG